MPFKYATSAVSVNIDDGDILDYLRSAQSELEESGVRVLKLVGPVFRRSFAEQFKDGGDPDPWTENTLSTLQRKSRRQQPTTRSGRYPRRLKQFDRDFDLFLPGGVLIDQGALRDSYVRVGARGHVERQNPDGSIEVGSSLPYAARQQDGFHSRDGREVPSRKLVIRDKDINAIKSIIFDTTMWALKMGPEPKPEE